MSRGVSNNNPGNLRISNQHWLGKISPSRDPDFETFDTAEHGLRALAKVLLTYFHEGLNTIEAIIAKWAPAGENNTDAYIDAVSDMTGFDSDAPLTPDAVTLAKLTSAIVFHENGKNPYPADLIQTAVKDALS